MIAVTDNNVYFIRDGKLWVNSEVYYDPPTSKHLIGVAASSLENCGEHEEHVAVIDVTGKVYHKYGYRLWKEL